MKKLLTICLFIFGIKQINAQCTVTIAQNPVGLICGINPTLTASAAGGGGLTINQNQPTNTTCMAAMSQGGLAQSFIPSVNTICGAGIFLTSNGAGSGSVTISLYTNLPNAGGVLLATGTVVGSDNTWVDVFWPSPVAVSVGTTYYLVFSGTNGSHCIAGNTANPYPSGNVFANAGYGSFPSYDYTFHTYSGCSIPSYLWSTGSTSSAITATVSGAYTVTMTVGGCTTSAVQSITINPTPTITVNSGSICAGSAFTMVPGGASTYTFQGGSAVVSPTVNASYTVVGTSSAGCVSQSFATSNITVSAMPVITVNSGSICSGNSFTMVPGGANTYTFQGGNAVVSPTVNSSYTVTGTSTAGCISASFATSNVTVNATPTISVNSGSICSGNSFTMVPSGANSYTFQGGSAVVSPTANASYTVVGSSTAGCISQSFATSNVTVNTTPTIAVNSGSICLGNSFTIVPSGANTYTIQGGNAIVSPTANANYTVVGTSSAGCVSSQVTSSVSINASPLPTITVNSGSICAGNAFTIVPSGANSYTIQGGNAVVSPTANATYTVVGTNTAGCISQSFATSAVTVSALPSVSVAGSGTICVGNSTVLTASGANSYSWNTGATTSSISASPTVNTNYTVIGTSSVSGCANSASASVVVSPCTGVQTLNLKPEALTVYPNPSNGEFTVELNNGLNKIVEVIDLTGRVVLTSNTSKDKINVSISHLANGIYYLKIQDSGATRSFKIVKQ